MSNAPDGALPLPATKLSALEQELVITFAELVQLIGLPRSMGEIYGLLFASPRPLGFAEIEQKLGLSKGSVSQGLKALRSLNAVLEASVDEQNHQATAGADHAKRISRWLPNTELRELMGSLLKSKIVPYLERQSDRLNAAEKLLALENRLGSEQAVLRQRLVKASIWNTRAHAILPTLGRLL